MANATFHVEVIGELLKKDGKKILVTNIRVPEHIQFLISLILEEQIEDIINLIRIEEESRRTLFKILNLRKPNEI